MAQVSSSAGRNWTVCKNSHFPTLKTFPSPSSLTAYSVHSNLASILETVSYSKALRYVYTSRRATCLPLSFGKGTSRKHTWSVSATPTYTVCCPVHWMITTLLTCSQIGDDAAVTYSEELRKHIAHIKERSILSNKYNRWSPDWDLRPPKLC